MAFVMWHAISHVLAVSTALVKLPSNKMGGEFTGLYALGSAAVQLELFR
jgi:hypothetical protein